MIKVTSQHMWDQAQDILSTILPSTLLGNDVWDTMMPNLNEWIYTQIQERIEEHMAWHYTNNG